MATRLILLMLCTSSALAFTSPLALAKVQRPASAPPLAPGAPEAQSASFPNVYLLAAPQCTTDEIFGYLLVTPVLFLLSSSSPSPLLLLLSLPSSSADTAGADEPAVRSRARAAWTPLRRPPCAAQQRRSAPQGARRQRCHRDRRRRRHRLLRCPQLSARACPSCRRSLIQISYAVMLWSEYTLKTTGCGLPAGPGGLLGALEGISYLFVVGLVGYSVYTKVCSAAFTPRVCA